MYYLELIQLQLEHTDLYQLLRLLRLNLPQQLPLLRSFHFPFQEFSKNYLYNLMVPLFQHFFCHFFLFCLYLYNIIIKLQMFHNNYRHILLNYILALLHQYHEHPMLLYCLFCLFNNNWSTIFKHCLFIGIICCCICCCSVCNCYSFFSKYICITITT